MDTTLYSLDTGWLDMGLALAGLVAEEPTPVEEVEPQREAA